MEGVVKPSGSVGDNTMHVVRRRLEEVDGGDVVHRIPILIKEKVEGDSMLTQVLNVDQWGQYILAESIVDQDLVDLLVRRSTGDTHCLIQIQHLNNALCKFSIQNYAIIQFESETVRKIHGMKIYPYASDGDLAPFR